MGSARTNDPNGVTRNFGLDLVRTCSILLVLLQHASMGIPDMGPLEIGVIGVEIFFVLSGFLIGGILFRDLDKNNSPFSTLKTFLIRRWYRILPLYFLVLIVSVLLYKGSIGTEIMYYIFFLQGINMKPDFFVVSWSLSVEEWFYLITPVFLIAVFSFTRKPAHVVTAIVAFMLLSMTCRAIWIVQSSDVVLSYLQLKGIPFIRFDSLYWGVLLSYLHHIKSATFEKLKSSMVFLLGLVIIIAYIVSFKYFLNGNDDAPLIYKILGFPILSFGIALLIPFTGNLPTPARSNMISNFFFWFVTLTSTLTYAIYLIHPFFYTWLHGQNGLGLQIMKTLSSILHSDTLANLTFFSIRFLIIGSAAYIIYRFFEKPILDFRDKRTGIKGVQLPD